ncbi:DcaP family trimeric outer membrane transporter [Sphingomonas sp. RB56-2]|uniref:DcaP family trimeric outer membrane transporter n=1 Tax=Sphingomonas brevis TaxID=2908206 RepID=A0ABT0SCR7_9SPHN|nr:DcaP family trimeric outer membrane transporter [Sphingomonas brevis]MCL6741875.1 DcaP family trimeric outer membrane transporter [Sphingomonas brevis]
MRKAVLAASVALVATPAWAADQTSQVSGQSQQPVLLATAAAAAQSAQPLTEAERQQAIQDLQDLRARMTALEQRLGITPPPVQYTPEAPKRAKDHNLELYGFVQLDAIQDFKRVNPNWDATLRPSRIPTEEGIFGGNGQSIFSVRQSRLGAKATGILAGKPYEAKFEFDLYGTGVDEGQTTFRVRHMYAKWGQFLIGQTNTLFMDGDIFPNVVDYWGPTGMVFVRTPQIRWTFLDSGGWQAAVALEHPSDDIDTGNLRLIDEDIASSIQANEELPDLTAAVRYGGDWGHVRLAGILRKVGFDTKGTEGNEPEGHETGWGLNLTSAFKLGLATPRLGIVYGRGIATYLNDGGMDLAPSINVVPQPGGLVLVPEATAVKLLGVSAYVDLQWSKQLSSAIGYSFTKVDNTNFQDGSAFHKGEYASANLLYAPADNVLAGLELLWGKRTDNDGEDGSDTRAQMTFKWSFTSSNIWDWFE